MHKEPGDCSTTGVIILVAVTVILVAIVLLFLLSFLSFVSHDQLAPSIIQVTSVLHTTPSGTMNDASRVNIQNKGTVEYKNGDLMAEFYNGHEKLYAKIYTLHGTDFIPTRHFGVATIGGTGCRGDFFSPNEEIGIDLTNGYYRPGDLVELRIYQKSNDNSMTPLTGNLLHSDYMQDWLKENFYSDHTGYRIISQHQFRA